MTKRFQVETDEGFVVSLKDNLTKKYPFSLACESVDDYENVIDEVMSCGALLNQLWEQTRRFEKHNQELAEENEELKKELHKIKSVNELLSMDFANSEHALWEENKQLKLELKNLRKLVNEMYMEGSE